MGSPASTTALLLIAPVWRATLRFGTNYNEGGTPSSRLDGCRASLSIPLSTRCPQQLPASLVLCGGLARALARRCSVRRPAAGVHRPLRLGCRRRSRGEAALGRRPCGAGSGFLLLGYNAALYPGYVGVDDPQWLGHGIMLLGLLTFFASEQRGWLFLLSAGLMLAAGFVKHLLLPIPLAATLWLALHRREALALWLVACAALLASALALCFAAYGSGFFEGVFRDTSRLELGQSLFP